MHGLGRFAGRFVLFAGSYLLLAAAPLGIPASGRAGDTLDRPTTGVDSLREVLGLSGNLRAMIGVADSVERLRVLQGFLTGIPLVEPGVHPLPVTTPEGDSLVIVTLLPFGALKGERLAGYRVGRWPRGGRAAYDPRYAPPPGFIPVTPENAATPVSKRFALRDFLTHDQADVWPKFLVLRVPLLDKLELIGDELARRGLSDRLHIMSGFRTPQYNAPGVGAKGGRSAVSRHMYGDAADIFVDGNHDGVMDDLDGDGRITLHDAQVLLAVADDVEARYPELVGGLSAYPSNSEHGPFVHVDVRGLRARW